ncbi:TPA: helix-turn-helix transcriptional regulator [Enterobacter cloacae]|jgi:transcriptional regulator with XRE-family HTH domain|uniref:helix-turn-helix domain-containing protein n=1 Tax=Enterobacter cloacae TaxID=550 RepID=UPI000B8C8454|nr:helix-turn-helix transcriptional regulator [Enterobacter cloacae]MCU6285022.1 helix-turn-helix transcriptional regulator [Enterobacter cloacae]OXU36545.1 transcriptional regulator [Enterobacter cloacae subsp. cloacae]HEC5282996.1 helix-turn-helix transcriptional regulator [Enterobacter cloacae]
MSFAGRFTCLRKQSGLTQSQMAEKIGTHLTQVRRYESGDAQPSLEILKRIALAFNLSTDGLLFEDSERELESELRLRLEAIQKMDEEEQEITLIVLDALILRHQVTKK